MQLHIKMFMTSAVAQPPDASALALRPTTDQRYDGRLQCIAQAAAQAVSEMRYYESGR